VSWTLARSCLATKADSTLRVRAQQNLNLYWDFQIAQLTLFLPWTQRVCAQSGPHAQKTTLECWHCTAVSQQGGKLSTCPSFLRGTAIPGCVRMQLASLQHGPPSTHSCSAAAFDFLSRGSRGQLSAISSPQYPPAMANEPPATNFPRCEPHPFTRRSSSRSRLRALCNWDFEFPIEHPKIWAISLCS